MKIKKIYQGTLPDNKILNEPSDSQTDTYSCNFINKVNDYSTEEQEIGTWTDGKPLYRKTITVNIGTSTSQSIDLSNLSYETILLDQGNSFFEHSDIYIIPFGHSAGGNDWSRAYFYSKKIYLTFGSTYSSLNKKVTFTIKYTKTTD